MKEEQRGDLIFLKPDVLILLRSVGFVQRIRLLGVH